MLFQTSLALKSFKEKSFFNKLLCIENLIRLQPAVGIFHSVAQEIELEVAVADRILTTGMDELVELFEKVDVAFVDDYTAARSLDYIEEIFPPAPWVAATASRT